MAAGSTSRVTWEAHFDRIIGSPILNSIIFGVFVVSGSLYIVLSKFLGVNQALITVVPVGLIISYAVCLFAFRALRLRDDQSGDNAYYMGFLFTLVSLAVSLYQFTVSHAAEDIVQNFGIAIFTTIAGIAVRVIFNQVRQDPVEVERVARLELADAARRVRRELDNTTREFAFFRRAAQQATIDAFEEVRARVDTVGNSILAGLGEVANKATAPFESVSKKSADALEELTRMAALALENSTREIGASADRVSTGASTIAASLDAVSQKLASMQTPDRVIEIRLEPTIRSLGEAVDKFSIQSAQQSGGVQAVLAAVQECTNLCATILANVRDQGAASSQELARIVEQVRLATVEVARTLTVANEEARGRDIAAQETLRIAQQAADQLTSTTSSVKVDMTAHLNQVQALFGQDNERLTAWTQALNDAAARQEISLRTLTDNLVGFTRAAENLRRTIERTLDTDQRLPDHEVQIQAPAA